MYVKCVTMQKIVPVHMIPYWSSGQWTYL